LATVTHPRTRRVLESLVVHREPLDQEFTQSGGGPLPELGAAGAADAVSDGQDGGERVVPQTPTDLAVTLMANLQVLLTGCGFDLLTCLVDSGEVGRNVLGRGLKQLRHLGLGEPQRFFREPALDPRPPVGSAVEDHAGGGRGGVVAHGEER
jgi:hypothetical protein